MMNKNMLTIGKSALGGKNKTQLKIFIGLFSLLFLLIPFFSQAAPNLDYKPMENIPGFEAASKTGDFYDYIRAVYKFGIWAVGVAALLMISIGGFMYITSAGNNSSMEKAKSVITDAIIGLVLALTAYLLLYIINPDLVRIQKITPIGVTPPTTGHQGVPPVTGLCPVPSNGSCSISNLGVFGSNAEKISRICQQESGGNPALSGTDKCKDGNSFSFGLFQINMITSAGSIGCNGADIFDINTSSIGTCPEKTGSGGQGTCLECKTNSKGTKYCSKWDCVIKSGAQAKYTECVAKLKDNQVNISIANALSGGGANLSPWLTTKNFCGL